MGSKAKNLSILAQHGFRTPRGFALDAQHSRAAFETARDAVMAPVIDPAAVRRIVESLELPLATRVALEEGIAAIPDAESFAVRSSGLVVSDGNTIGEDGHAVSLAGQFDSFLNVPRERVAEAVLSCWGSLFNHRSACRFQIDDRYLRDSGMAVVVQEYIVAKASAVMMTVDPLGAGDKGALECTWGACDAIVAGTVSPDDIEFDRRTGEITGLRVGAKQLRVDHSRYDGAVANGQRSETSPAERRSLALDEATVRELIRIGAELEALFNCPQDIEAVTDFAGDIVIVQARPVTVLPPSIVPFNPNNEIGAGS